MRFLGDERRIEAVGASPALGGRGIIDDVATPGSDPSRDPLASAIELLATGAWQQAHAIVQQHDSALAAWLHGIVHTLEGDLDNARYWYKHAGRPFPGTAAVQQEIAAARDRVREEAGGDEA